MTPPFSEYMEWAKTCSAAPFNLASSGVAAFPLADLGARIEDLEICGPSAYGYAPLQERLAHKAGVDPDRVVHATGTSMANLLVTLMDKMNVREKAFGDATMALEEV